jgi:hypothetical protein
MLLQTNSRYSRVHILGVLTPNRHTLNVCNMRKLLAHTSTTDSSSYSVSHYDYFHAQRTTSLSCVIYRGYGDNTGLVTTALSSYERGIIFSNSAFFHPKIHRLFANQNLFYTYIQYVYMKAHVFS